MKTQPVAPARIEFDADGPPRAPDFDDIYHPRIGPLAQARHVFLGGNQLPARWAGRERFVILETGFGLGNNFLASWDAWRNDPARCRQLVFVSIERHPPTRADLARAHRDTPLPALARALVEAWPPLTPNLHPIDFDGGRVRLLLGFGDVATLLPELQLRADAFFLDGFAPARNAAMWETRVLKALGRRAAVDATAATWSVAHELRAGLTAAGFEVELGRGIGGKREITVAHYRPRYRPRFAVKPPAVPARREALVVGAGLAGAAVARALVDEGWQVQVFDRQPAPAAETSGNAAGLFHGTVHGADGPHARLLRSAALLAERHLRPLVDGGHVQGQLHGLLRLDARDAAAMQALLEGQRLPADWVQALDAAQASALAGVALPSSAWLYPGGGWLAPATLVAEWLAADGIRFSGGRDVRGLQSTPGGWALLDAAGRPIAEAPVVVLANAGDAARLLGADWPLQSVRGQVSGWTGAVSTLALPVAGDGYAIPLPDGLLCGATNAAGDSDPSLREADQRENFDRLHRLTGLLPPADPVSLQGRVGWRLQADDRLPVAGPVPQSEPHTRVDQARLWPRVPGLFVCCALGGRGITLAPLLGRLLAAQIAGSPLPLEQSLVDAIDPARWQVRAVRRERSA